MRNERTMTRVSGTSVSTTNGHSLQQLTQRLADLSLAGAIATLPELVSDPGFWHAYVAPLLDGVRTGDVTIAHTIGSQSDSAVLQLFVWPPGSATQIHDHSCWGVLHCISGVIREERYERLDDGTQLEVAHLSQAWARSWRREDGVTTVLPYDGGIHRVANPGAEVAISAHIYGPRLGVADGRDYDPNRDYVCDRFEP